MTPAASPIELIVLGFFMEREMNAYDLASIISEKQINRFLKISVPAVYKSCKRLHAEGFLEGRVVKDSAFPEKTVYRLSAMGRTRFYALMEHYSAHFMPFFLENNVLIWNIEKLDKKDGTRFLENLRDQLRHFAGWIREHEKEQTPRISFGARAIVKQYRMMIDALCVWSDELIADYKKLKKHGADR